MSDDLVRITVSGGKYTFVQKTDGSCYALRYGEPWREDIFDGMTLAMAHRIEELEANLAKAVEALGTALSEMVDYADTHPAWSEIWEAREAARTTLAELTSSEAANGEAKGGKDE